MADREALASLLDSLCEELAKRIRDGSAGAADLNVARQLLKDNGIQAIATKDNPIGRLSLPFTMTDEDRDGLAN